MGRAGQHVPHVNTITDFLLQLTCPRTDRYALSKQDIITISTACRRMTLEKITISDKILNKPGRLTAEEFSDQNPLGHLEPKMLLELPAAAAGSAPCQGGV